MNDQKAENITFTPQATSTTEYPNIAAPIREPNAGDKIENGFKYAGQIANDAYQQAKATVDSLYAQGKIKADEISAAVDREKIRLEKEWRRMSGSETNASSAANETTLSKDKTQ